MLTRRVPLLSPVLTRTCCPAPKTRPPARWWWVVPDHADRLSSWLAHATLSCPQPLAAPCPLAGGSQQPSAACITATRSVAGSVGWHICSFLTDLHRTAQWQPARNGNWWPARWSEIIILTTFPVPIQPLLCPPHSWYFPSALPPLSVCLQSCPPPVFLCCFLSVSFLLFSILSFCLCCVSFPLSLSVWLKGFWTIVLLLSELLWGHR